MGTAVAVHTRLCLHFNAHDTVFKLKDCIYASLAPLSTIRNATITIFGGTLKTKNLCSESNEVLGAFDVLSIFSEVQFSFDDWPCGMLLVEVVFGSLDTRMILKEVLASCGIG